MAIAIAIVLFFLSVAMVTANRQNFIVSAHLDNRIQAEAAARAGASVAIQTMRTDPQWRLHLAAQNNTIKGNLDGADYNATISPYTDPGGTDYFWLVDGQGVSQSHTDDYRTVVEEVKMQSALQAGDEAFMFAYDDTTGDLMMLNGGFKWQDFGPAPETYATLAANNGPLFTFGGLGTARPAVDDWRIVTVGNKKQLQLMQIPFATQPPPQTLVYFTFVNQQGQFNPIPDPGLTLGRQLAPSVNGQPYQNKPIPANATLVGGSLEWYDLVGQGLAANGNQIYCHALHTIYVGASIVGGVVQQPAACKAPAVLMYDLTQKKWTVVCDMVKDSDLRSLPQIQTGYSPDVNSLGLVGGAPYAPSARDLTKILTASGNSWQIDGTGGGISLGLFNYQGKLVTFVPGANGGADFSNGLTPATELNVTTQSVRALVSSPMAAGGFMPMTVRSGRTVTGALWASDLPLPNPDAQNPFLQPTAAYQTLSNGGEPYIAFAAGPGGTQIPYHGARTVLAGNNPSIAYVFNNVEDNGLGTPPNPTTPPNAPIGNTHGYGADCVAIAGNELWSIARMTYTDTGGVPQGLVPGAATSQPKTFYFDVLAHFDGTHWQAWPGDMSLIVPTSTNNLADIPVDNTPTLISPEHMAMAVYENPSGNVSRIVPVVYTP